MKMKSNPHLDYLNSIRDLNHERAVSRFLRQPKTPTIIHKKQAVGSKQLGIEYNLSELRKLWSVHRFEVIQFSESHFRLVGKVTADYWPGSGTVWMEGCKSWKSGVRQLVDLVIGAAASPVPGIDQPPRNPRLPREPRHAIRQGNGAYRTGGPGYVYCGEVPPWDESLGDYREFTDRERDAGEVCFYRA